MRIDYSQFFNSAIPDLPLPIDVKELTPTHSPFVEIDKNLFVVEMQYVKLGMVNSEKGAYLRKDAYEILLQAQKLLPEGYFFKILDAWRPFALQEELFYAYRTKIIEEFSIQNLPSFEQDQFVKRFVSLPKNTPLLPPVHTTGGAIDLTIVDENGNELPMGTYFDEFTDRTNSNYFEKNISDKALFSDISKSDISIILGRNKDFTKLSLEQQNIQIALNRRLLYNIMTSVGFSNLPSEWWHFDYFDRFYAFYNNTSSNYEGVFTKEELKNYLDNI